LPTTLKLRAAPAGGWPPVEAAILRPDRIASLPRRALERLPLVAGNRVVALADLFEVGGDGTDDDVVVVEGDLGSFALVGAGMMRGRLEVHGPAGARAGSEMSGGSLVIEGDAGPYAGQGMTGGLLAVGGAAGDHLAAPLPGARTGMNRGTVLVRGHAGQLAGRRMRRGMIVIGGDAGPGAGCGMLAGTIVALGRLGPGAGALMRRGTILALGPAEILPVFLDAGARRAPFLNLYFRQIESAGFDVPREARQAAYRRRVGDISDLGKGEILTLERPT